MKWLRWFVAGAVAVPLFHQLALLILSALGVVDRQPYSMEGTAPFGVPQVISLSFWGGVWGIVLGLLLPDLMRGVRYWLLAFIFGAVAPTLVALLVVAPLKGQPVALDARRIVIGAVLNGTWGLGTAALYAGMTRVRRRRSAPTARAMS